MLASLIISTYNQAKNLQTILNTVKCQTTKSFEIIVADDGSSDDPLQVVNAFKAGNPDIPIRFITQEDRGFRKTVILNSAIKIAKSDYLIFIDGDMLLHNRFIEMHLQNKKENVVLCGYRGVKIGQQLTMDILDGRIRTPLSVFSIFIHWFRGKLEHPARGLILKNKNLRRLIIKNRKGLSGCNFSLTRIAIERVNGFNEDIQRHGYNDFELGHRLQLAGFRLENVSRLCITQHLFHPTRKIVDADLEKKLSIVRSSKNSWCNNGIRSTN